MKELKAYCGLDCEKCEARIATIKDDRERRIRIAKEWSEMNGVNITPEMINCDGCRADERKTPFCDRMCPIRQCAMGKNLDACGDCAEAPACGKLSMISGDNDEAKANLGL